jgi:hypothetical protein
MDWDVTLGIIATAAGFGALCTAMGAMVTTHDETRADRVAYTVILVLICAVTAGLSS